MPSRVGSLLFLSAVFLFAPDLNAVESEHTPPVPASVRINGWSGKTEINAGVNLSANDKVIGESDGSSTTVLGKIAARLDYNRDYHEFRNEITAVEGTLKTTTSNAFDKLSDSLTDEQLYIYHLQKPDWLSLFGRFYLATSLFQGIDTRPAAATYSIARTNGTVDTVTGDSLRLTQGFSPLETRQSLGATASAASGTALKWDGRVGYEFRQYRAEGQFALSDNPATPAVEVKELSNLTQSGVELSSTLEGVLSDKSLSYKLKAEWMLPVTTSGPTEGRSGIQLLNSEYSAQVDFKLSEIINLTYEFKLLRQPQLIDVAQVSQILVLSVHHAFLY
jgi:hypothetical protein